MVQRTYTGPVGVHWYSRHALVQKTHPDTVAQCTYTHTLTGTVDTHRGTVDTQLGTVDALPVT